MPRQLRLQYPDAIYHFKARGIGRQHVVRDDVDPDRLQERLGRAASAYLARLRTAATNAGLAPVLGLSRAETVPNLTRRFASLLAQDARTRDQLRRLEERLDGPRPP
jgi:hypothetical protein